jgi:hypothetical protein
VVPYYYDKKRAKGYVERCLPYLFELLGILRDLKVVVLCGNRAKLAAPHVRSHYPDLLVLETWHPNSQALNSPARSEHYERTIEAAARRATEGGGSR